MSYTTNLLTVTDEPTVTDDTRFFLTFEASSYYQPTDEHWHHRIRVEVSESTYRRAYNEAFGYADDMTYPLDFHWWRTVPVPAPDRFNFVLHSTRGGHIDWYGNNLRAIAS